MLAASIILYIAVSVVATPSARNSDFTHVTIIFSSGVAKSRASPFLSTALNSLYLVSTSISTNMATDVSSISTSFFAKSSLLLLNRPLFSTRTTLLSAKNGISLQNARSSDVSIPFPANFIKFRLSSLSVRADSSLSLYWFTRYLSSPYRRYILANSPVFICWFMTAIAFFFSFFFVAAITFLLHQAYVSQYDFQNTVPVSTIIISYVANLTCFSMYFDNIRGYLTCFYNHILIISIMSLWFYNHLQIVSLCTLTPINTNLIITEVQHGDNRKI